MSVPLHAKNNGNMKQWTSLLLAVLMAAMLSGCGARPASPADNLDRIDSISATNPQRAIELLDSLHAGMAEADSSTLMHYQLLRIKAYDRAYIRHTSDREILAVIDYYERHPEGDLLAWAYCYGGRVYRDLNNSPRALEYFQRSLAELEEVQNPNLRLRVLSQVGYLFYYQYLFPESRAVKREVIEADSLLGNFGKMVTCYTDIARCYIAEEKFDSAAVVARHVRQLARQHQLGRMIPDIDLIDAQVAEYQDRHAEAIASVVPYLNDTIVADLSPYLAVACRAYMAQGRYDEAEELCRRLLNDTHARRQTQVDALRYLSVISDSRGEGKLALKYHVQALNRLDSLVKSEKSEKVTLVSSFYQSLQHERQLQRLQEEKNQAEVRFYAILFVTICLLLAAGIVWLQHKRRQTERLLEQERSITQFRSTDLCQRIYALYYAQRPITGEMWEEIEDYLNDNHAHFLSRLSALSNYSEIEWHISLLSRLDFRNFEMAILLAKSKPAISLAKKRLFAKVKGQEGKAEDWDALIKKL